MAIQFVVLNPSVKAIDSQIELIVSCKGLKIGVEVTENKYALLMDHNIDPQHTGGDVSTSAVKWIVDNLETIDNWLIGCQYNLTLFTVRADLDSMAGFVLLKWLLQTDAVNIYLTPAILDRIMLIDLADTGSANTVWQPRELFSGANSSDLAAIARAVSDWKVDISQRVEWMETWLETGTFSNYNIYFSDYLKEKLEIENAVKSGETRIEVITENKLVVVESTLRSATSIGYSVAPVVIAFNSKFQTNNGTIAKYTVCQYTAGYVDLIGVKNELLTLEDGWGGSSNIIGSPQGESSSLSMDQVVDIVEKHLL